MLDRVMTFVASSRRGLVEDQTSACDAPTTKRDPASDYYPYHQ